VVADLHLEAEAATWMALRLAAAYDSDDDKSRALRRLATPVTKYWVCKRGPNHAYEALECLGGNGYTEDFPLARRYREQPVLAVWEGSGNVIALDVLRAMDPEPDSLEALDDELSSVRGQYPAFDAHVARLRALLGRVQADPVGAPGLARRLVEWLALALQGSIVIREAPSAIADAYVAARLSVDGGREYGSLAPELDLRAIVARA
jgi:putative acyl-CoA dehydrogenase